MSAPESRDLADSLSVDELLAVVDTRSSEPSRPRDPIADSGLAALAVGADVVDVAVCLRRLAALLNGRDPLDREVIRAQAITELERAHVSPAARMVDAALNGTGKGATAAPATVVLAEVTPCSEPVEGAAVLDNLADAFAAYIKLPAGGAQVLALWTLFAHAHDAFNVSPVLALTSPERRCAKSATLRMLSYLVPRPLLTANVSPASVFRAIEAFHATLLVDELDTLLGEDDGVLRGILNSGHLRDSALVVRCDGDAHDVRTFSTWGPKAVAMIGKLPATLEDRAVVLKMRRKRADEPTAPMRADRLADELRPLAQRCARWAKDHEVALRAHDPAMPPGFRDRLADNWRPLLAIADLAGWSALAWAAAEHIGGESRDGADDDGSVGAILLADVRAAFGESDRLTSEELVAILTALEGRPWPEWRHGRPLSPNQLARLLKPFEVRPKALRIGERTPRGYEKADFTDCWERYLAPFDPLPPGLNRNTATHE